jgi:deazaflavin-dependent oxidoreductase (nitroreductase family)
MDTNSSLSESTRAALNHSQLIDLTTTGRRTGQPRRIEIFLHHDDDQLFITGMPRADRTRDWIYNIEANPHVTIHLKQSVLVDVPATARVLTNPDERRPFIEAAARRWRRTDVPEMLRHSPLIVLTVGDSADHQIGL